jgi:putative transcriptional regulator
MTVADILEQMNIDHGRGAHTSSPVHYGGPVHMDRGFVLHETTDRPHWQSTLAVADRIALTTSRDILEAIAANEGPKDHLVALGYAGWGGGQLEEEIRANAWLSGPADYRIVFNTPVEQRYDAAVRAAGVDLSRLTHEAGHA